ncbi:MAG: tRNA uridine-5-carboxymethylaminomethyl(34) synthesis GTPase MnmE [Mycoplasmataceae bacterium]|jgi:tRNA modification GTPase|nr:tRNA uridine-5-carboxymethylaminomethyl(34) synthesis GTPase MnmE [Mycoplasmataceae bacterium]
MDTIVALATPLMNCAIHIIRVSGNDSYAIVNKISKNKITKVGFTIQRTNIIEDGQSIDDVLINKFVAPKTFTGEDVIEINCHGGVYIAQKIIKLLIKNGCRLAKAGEFSQRAFMNKKINIHHAKSINNLINASSDLAIKHANHGMNGKTLEKLGELKEQIFTLVGQVEVNIDYPEYDDVPTIGKKEFLSTLDKCINEATKIISDSKTILVNSKKPVIAIVGKPNVGKSSLLNCLIKKNKAIVSKVSGTTRDIVEETIDINGMSLMLFDTAGIRNSKNEIEKMGIDKTKHAIEEANLVIFVYDSSKPITAEDNEIIKTIKNKNHIIVANKSDLKQVTLLPQSISISTKNNDISVLEKTIANKFKKINFDEFNDAILQSNQDVLMLENINEKLKDVKQIIVDKHPIDLTLKLLHDALLQLTIITGENNSYDFITELFSKFCIGK